MTLTLPILRTHPQLSRGWRALIFAAFLGLGWVGGSIAVNHSTHRAAVAACASKVSR